MTLGITNDMPDMEADRVITRSRPDRVNNLVCSEVPIDVLALDLTDGLDWTVISRTVARSGVKHGAASSIVCHWRS